MRGLFTTLLLIVYLVIAPACFLTMHHTATDMLTTSHAMSSSSVAIAAHMTMYHAFTGADVYLYAFFFLTLLSTVVFLVRFIFQIRYVTRTKILGQGDRPPNNHSEQLLWLARHTLAPPLI